MKKTIIAICIIPLIAACGVTHRIPKMPDSELCYRMGAARTSGHIQAYALFKQEVVKRKTLNTLNEEECGEFVQEGGVKGEGKPFILQYLDAATPKANINISQQQQVNK